MDKKTLLPICNASMDVREMLANSKINILWSGFRIYNTVPELEEFFKNLETNNDLLLIFKSMERFCSKEGSAYIFFDIEKDKKIKLGVYKPDVANQVVKIDGLTEYAGVGVRTITITKTGTQVSVKECRTANETQVVPYGGTSSPMDVLPIDTFTITMPEKINELSTIGTRVHNYGVLSMKQIINKNIVDWEYNENVLPDDYSVQHLVPIINETLKYLVDEQELNKTRVMGQFSNQDIEKAVKTPNTMKSLLLHQQAGLIDSTLIDDYYERFYSPSRELATARLFVNTHGGANSVEIMKGDLDFGKLVDGLNRLIELYYNGAGMSYALGQASTNTAVKSIQEIQAQSRTTFETIKMTNTLRRQQIEEFFERIMIAYGLNPMKYRGLWNVDIVSNILNEQDTDKDTIIKLFNNGLLSQEEAIKRANPNMKPHDIELMLKDLKEKQEVVEKVVDETKIDENIEK